MQSDPEFIRNELRITCSDSLELMTEYLERALSVEDRNRFGAHLRGCEACAVYLDQLRSTVRITGTLTGEDTYRIERSTMEELVDIYRQSR